MDNVLKPVVNPQLSYYMELGALLTEAKTVTDIDWADKPCLDKYYDAIKNLADSNNDTKLSQTLNRSFVQKLTPDNQNLVKRELLDTLLQMVINATTGMAVPVPDVIKVVADPKTFQGLMIVPGNVHAHSDMILNRKLSDFSYINGSKKD